jgi:hypothetical protein
LNKNIYHDIKRPSLQNLNKKQKEKKRKEKKKPSRDSFSLNRSLCSTKILLPRTLKSAASLIRFLLSQQLQSPIYFTAAPVTDQLIHQVSPSATPTTAPAASSLSRCSSSSAPAAPHHQPERLLLFITALVSLKTPTGSL